MMRYILAALLLVSCTPNITFCQPPDARAAFITRRGDQLYERGRVFRFISFNIPNLHYVEDDLRFDRVIPFRWPDAYEIEDALESVRQMGGRVVRIYTLSVRKADDPDGMPRHVLGPGQFNERGFRALDLVLQLARTKGIRLIIPFVDNWKWWGGVPQYAAFRGKPESAFWTDDQLIHDFKQTIDHVVNRVNTRTGIAYRDDPTILAWETGNELHCPPVWTRQITAYIKQLDGKHLVMDGKHTGLLEESSLADPNVDLVQTHHYERDPRQMIARIRRSAAMARGRKPYVVGEFGFICTEAMRAVMDTIIQERITGGLVWSLRYHSRDGGFFWHQEPAGGDFFKAYHWPGFASGEAYDETQLLSLMRGRAFAIRGRAAPPVPAPATPKLLSVTSGGLVNWQGSAGASGYDVQRAATMTGPWLTVGYNVSDARVQYRPPFVDREVQPGKTYFYRLLARNAAGQSAPSAPVGPIHISHRTLVDELRNEGRMFLKQGKTTFEQKQSRKFKEDAHRITGQDGASVIYQVPEQLRAVRLYVFAHDARPALKATLSKDGQKFDPVRLIRTSAAAGDAQTYGFWTPVLLHATDVPAGVHFVRVQFLSDAQLARVELDYGSSNTARIEIE